MQSEDIWMDLRALYRHGWTVSALSREYKLHRQTVRRELAADGERRYAERAAKHPLTEAQLAHIARRLSVCPTVRGTDLHRELARDYSYVGSYPTFQRDLRALRQSAPREAEVRFETAPGVQTQADWKHIGLWPLGHDLAPLYAMVAVLGHSRKPAIRISNTLSREATFERLVRCIDDLGGVTREILTDRDSAFCNHGPGSELFVPEWVDLCALLGTVPRACRPYRAKTKGKVERVNREIEESFLAWLLDQVLPRFPCLADYDDLAQQWIDEVLMPRKHRTTKRIVAEAWAEERPLLTAVPDHILQRFTGGGSARPVLTVVDLSVRNLGEHVDIRPLEEYEAML